MNEAVAARRDGSEGLRTAGWVVGAAIGSQVLAGLVFGIFIGAGELVVLIFSLGEQGGVPLFNVLLAFATLINAAAIHLAVSVVRRSTAIPWVIWPAMAVLPTAWVFVVLANGSGALEPILAVLQLVGLGVAFVTLGERRWTKG